MKFFSPCGYVEEHKYYAGIPGVCPDCGLSYWSSTPQIITLEMLFQAARKAAEDPK